MEPSDPAAPPPSYETVEPLLARSQVNGATMEYVFRCPVTGLEVTASAPVPHYELPRIPSLGEQTVKMIADPNLGFEAGEAADRMVPFSGTIASFGISLRRRRRGAKQAEESNKASFAAAEEASRQMVVTAFSTVADQFTWDASGARWVKAAG